MIKIIAGLISGICTGLGLGGGSVLILILTLFLSIDQRIAQATNIICFIPSSIIAIITNIKNKNINFKLAFKILFFGIIGSSIGSIISSNLNINILKKVFAVFLIIIGFNEFLSFIKMYIKDKKGDTK